MSHVLTLKRRRGPRQPGEEALLFYSLIAASGFATGWAAHLFGF